MKKLFLLLLFLFLVHHSSLWAADDSLQVNALPFKLGEDLTFKIRYGFIKAGTAHMRIVGMDSYKDRPVIHIQTTAVNVPAFRWIYKVDDVVNVFVDPVNLRPLYFEKKLREGTYKADLFVRYQHEDSVAQVEFIRYKDDMKIRKREAVPVRIPANVFDVLSAFYYVRTQDLQVGKSIFLTSLEKKKIYDLEIKTHRKEIIKVTAGKFRCLVIEPLLKGEGIFKQKGRLLIWLTDDQYKIPVQMTSKIVVGHITSELTHMKNVPENIPARIK